MAHSLILLYILRLAFGTLVVVASICVWYKSRDVEWLCITFCGIFSFCESVILLFRDMQIVRSYSGEFSILVAIFAFLAAIIRNIKI